MPALGIAAVINDIAALLVVTLMGPAKVAIADPYTGCEYVGAGPVGPIAPVAPVAPVIPDPVGPVAPVAPVPPPAGPVNPVAPRVPVGPVAPVTPDPVGPVDPVTPDPVGPVAPVTPVAPIRPTGPESLTFICPVAVLYHKTPGVPGEGFVACGVKIIAVGSSTPNCFISPETYKSPSIYTVPVVPLYTPVLPIYLNFEEPVNVVPSGENGIDPVGPANDVPPICCSYINLPSIESGNVKVGVLLIEVKIGNLVVGFI